MDAAVRTALAILVKQPYFGKPYLRYGSQGKYKDVWPLFILWKNL
ncbi:hypothetical protein [Pontibacter mucosus]|nr:hypothetical protein [Pontibacter mucosus]